MEQTNPAQTGFNEEDSIDIKRYLSLFISNWYWFASALFLALTLAYGINRYSQKIYTISSSLLIKDDQNSGMSNIAADVIPGGDIFRSQQNLRNEIEILKSYSLNYMVMKALTDFHVVYIGVGRRGLVESVMYKDCPFRVVYDSLELQRKGVHVGISILSEQQYRIEIDGDLKYKAIKNFGEKFSERGFDFYLEKRNPGSSIYTGSSSNNYYFYFTDPAKLANIYRSRLIVAPKDKESSLVTLSISGYVTEQETDYLNKLMETYISYGLDFKKMIAEKTISFINSQLDIISDSLEIAAKKLEDFRMKNEFIDLKSEVTVIQNRMSRNDNEKIGIEMQLQYYNYLLEYVNERYNKNEIISPSIIGMTDQVLLNLLNGISTLQIERERLALNLEKNQPAIEHMDRQINEAKTALQENIRNSIIGLQLSKAEIEKNIASNESEVNKLPSTEKTFVAIQRQFDLNNTIYTYLLEKRAESGIARASTLPDNRIIDIPQVKGLVKPKEKKNLMIALVLGLLIPGAAISLIDFFNNRVIDKKDVIAKTKVPVIGFISHSESRNEIVVIENPGSALAESFRSLRTSLRYFLNTTDVTVIAVSSTVSSEGKTFISINLAAIMAMLGKKVLLIGLDLRKPRINEILKYKNSPGMSGYLTGECKYEEMIMQTHIDNLYYVPSGPTPPNPAELIESDKMTSFMERAKNEYEYIIIDTPPVAVVTDALLVARFADANLFIVRQRYTSRNTLEMIEQLNSHGQLRNMAIVLNDISLSGYYGYGLRYGNLSGYGYSYGTSYYGSNYYGKYQKRDKSESYYRSE
jgi:tyrosine-protein kinase Etk/Wzc